MRRFCAIVTVVLAAGTSPAEQYSLVRDSTLRPPRLGDGFDPTLAAVDKVRPPALLVDAVPHRHLAVKAEVSIYELLASGGRSEERQFAGEGALAEFLKAKLQVEDFAGVLEKHSVFVVQAVVINGIETAENPRLREEAGRLDAGRFREVHGPRFVQRVDYGGYIYLLYVFRTRELQTRQKIIASLQAAYADTREQASLSWHLERNRVSSEFTMYAVQDGGALAPFLDPNLAGFRTYLPAWVKSVAEFPTVVRFFTSRYHDAVPDFPHRWLLGFGPARLE